MHDFQQEKIEHYLLGWNLEYKDFYDEVLDHLMEGVGRFMEKGNDFDTSFTLAKRDFAGKKFKSHYGLKAMEMEYASLKTKEFKRQIQVKVRQQFTSWRILIWLALFLLGYVSFLEHSEWFLRALFGLFIFGMALLVFLSPKGSWFSKTSSFLVNDHLPLEKRKEKLLFKNSNSRIRMKAFGGVLIFFNGLTLLANTSKVLNGKEGLLNLFGVVVVLTILAYLAVIWAYLELVISERKLKIDQ